jgi:hypothetical protein
MVQVLVVRVFGSDQSLRILLPGTWHYDSIRTRQSVVGEACDKVRDTITELISPQCRNIIILALFLATICGTQYDSFTKVAW